MILKTIDHVKHISRREVSLDSILQMINKISATKLDSKTLKLELDQMIIKGLIDQNYKILHRDRLDINLGLPSPDKVNFTFSYENGDNTVENLDKNLPFINNQETRLTNSREECQEMLRTP